MVAMVFGVFGPFAVIGVQTICMKIMLLYMTSFGTPFDAALPKDMAARAEAACLRVCTGAASRRTRHRPSRHPSSRA
jgi:hypothetical protein